MPLPYILYAQTMIVCGDLFLLHQVLNRTIQSAAPDRPEAWVPAYGGSHAEPLYYFIVVLLNLQSARCLEKYTL